MEIIGLGFQGSNLSNQVGIYGTKETHLLQIFLELVIFPFLFLVLVLRLSILDRLKLIFGYSAPSFGFGISVHTLIILQDI